jgi:hypothetical protein
MHANPEAVTLIVIAIIVGGFYILPLLFVLFSSRSHGGATFGWFIITLLFSWLGFAIFLIFTQKPREREAARFNPIEPRF